MEPKTIRRGHEQLEDLQGVGPASAKALRAVDVLSVEALASYDPDDLEAKLTMLHEAGASKTNWGPQAAAWIETARATREHRPQARELSSFTVRFEVAVETVDDIEVHAYVCYVYDEKGPGEEVRLGADPQEWAQFILSRASLPASVLDRAWTEPSTETQHQRPELRAEPVIQPGGTMSVRLTTDAKHASHMVFAVLADDGSVAYTAVTPDRKGATLPCSILEPGLYRSFAWVQEQSDNQTFHAPILGPVIRVNP